MSRLTRSQQSLRIYQLYPEAKIIFTNSHLLIKMDIKPSPLSKTYPISIKHYYKNKIEIWVTGNLKNLAAPDFPHIYDKNVKLNHAQLCLFLPGNREWSERYFIGETIIPWASEWLLHYELWLSTGKWHGGGIDVQG